MKQKSPTTFPAKSWIKPLLTPLLTLAGLYKFSCSFFLAKKSLPHISQCSSDYVMNTLLSKSLKLNQDEIDFLIDQSEIISEKRINPRGKGDEGCWIRKKPVESIALLVVDAMRFDFAQHYLPKSVGSRLSRDTQNSKLFKFVADPPTVTMQRLKGLTTGGLPTFADISGSFGGANIDEDNWVHQFKNLRNSSESKIAFVGDDTWIDLFPDSFDDSHPYPSFNTRDLDTVDNGCLKHLPRLLKSFGKKSSENYYEIMIVHFLGVDHVGHTYGPNNFHMAQKFNQIDDALSGILDQMDSSEKCQAAYIFGDHGMTEDGNHGGGTPDEINAALFAHYSPACSFSDQGDEGLESGELSQQAYRTINQIDFVPSISILLGLPIPFANLGGLVTSLIPTLSSKQLLATTTALALNAGQVWNYLTSYSQQSNSLPKHDMSDLQSILDDAILKFKSAISEENELEYKEASGLFKLFLSQATDMGKRVWTRFDTTGMTIGVMFVVMALILEMIQFATSHSDPSQQLSTIHTFYLRTEYIITFLFSLFHCILLTFSNSYIIEEQYILMFMMSTLCILLGVHRHLMTHTTSSLTSEISRDTKTTIQFLALVIVSSRTNELFIKGHGLDPSLRVYTAHHPLFFGSTLLCLGSLRYHLFKYKCRSLFSSICDYTPFLCLAFSWYEKYTIDETRNGYFLSGASLFLSTLGILHFLVTSLNGQMTKKIIDTKDDKFTHRILTECVFRILVFIVTVTGPSSAGSASLYVLQTYGIYKLMKVSYPNKIEDPILAFLWRLSTRHIFFATGHACSFNQLQFSAAFVASDTFYYAPAGASLFLNTFGWDLIGVILLRLLSNKCKRLGVWKWYFRYQLVESLASCISVSLMKRHLMVWAIFAPRFVFGSIFMVITCICYILSLLTSDKKGSWKVS